MTKTELDSLHLKEINVKLEQLKQNELSSNLIVNFDPFISLDSLDAANGYETSGDAHEDDESSKHKIYEKASLKDLEVTLKNMQESTKYKKSLKQ